MSALIEFDHVCKYYQMGDTLVKAADHISMQINKGEFVAIVGQSGSGKSTCMNIIGCLDVPTAGTYKLNGRDVGRMSRDELAEIRNELLGFIFQQYNLLPKLSLMENVEVPLVYAGVPRGERHRRAAAALERVGLGDKLRNKPNQLSGGQQQRVSIARALAGRPAVILADEPTGALDSHTGREVLKMLQELHRQGNTVVLITHDNSIAVKAKRIVRLQDGRIIYDGDAAGIKASLRGIDLVLEEGLNVRVVSLPDGEDPDSYAQAHTAEEVLEYISGHETDFIHFKTKLLLTQAGSDPIERAKLITDIVRSISLIPDTITRSVYVQETANQMKVEEKLLYNEIARIRKEKVGDPTPLPYKSPTQQPPRVTLTPAKTVQVTPCDTEEMVLVRYLLLFGGQELYEEERDGMPYSVTVGEYIIHELAEDELEMLNPRLREIQNEYRKNYRNPGFIPSKYFIGNPDVSICELVADILSEPYELSKLWTLKDSSMRTEEMMLDELLPKIVDNYKMRRIEILCREADEKILEFQNAGDMERLVEWIKKKNAMIKVRSRINEKLKRTI